MPTVFLVMATSGQFEPPIPVRVFREREHAEAYQAEVIEYHLDRPEAPVSEDAATWKGYGVQVDEWRRAHPAGVAASDYRRFGLYEVPA